MGGRFYIRTYLGWIRLCSFRDRRLCPPDRGLEGQHVGYRRLRAGRLGTGDTRPQAGAGAGAGAEAEAEAKYYAAIETLDMVA